MSTTHASTQLDTDIYKKKVLLKMEKLSQLLSLRNRQEDTNYFIETICVHRDRENQLKAEKLQQKLIDIRESGLVSEDWFDDQFGMAYRRYN